MADASEEKPNGVCAEEKRKRSHGEEVTLYGVVRRMAAEIFFPDPDSRYGSTTLTHRVSSSLSENFPLLRETSINIGNDVVLWTRRGGPLRALLVVSVGIIALLNLTGLLLFMLFFLAATVNAIVISFLMALAAAGGFLVFFFACVTAIYIGVLSVAVFVISTATISAIIAVLIATGWIGFFLTLWLATNESMDFAKHSLTVTGSALSAYSAARHSHRRHEPDKVLD
ncbi:hypothetical protein Acr_00g0063260 [Actinidia rufa]|uniref:Transmembrane protein n=1 Tax=Actinidia rufa TaxID=165716 RepID=A0A7J0DPE9_9ERIC|nr:hypothetical protein Acr_00g0063260 [Actinidia rufa]